VHVFDTLKPLVANYIDSSVAGERMLIKSGYNQLIFIAKARVDSAHSNILNESTFNHKTS